MINSRLIKIALAIILVIALGLRVYKLGLVPPSISWDEAAFGVNASMIADYGHDEYGKFLPMYFISFGDDKHPIHIYITSVFVKLLGLNEFSTRFPSVLFGVLNVLLIFILGRMLFKSGVVGLAGAFFLAISPYGIHFSRFNHEANFMLFFFMLGFILFLQFTKGNQKLLPIAVASFALSFISYHPAKVIVPIIAVALIIIYYKKFTSKIMNAASIVVIAIFLTILFLNPQLLGFARASQNSLNQEDIKKTKFFELTNNELAGKANLIFNQYLSHFTSQYLFTQGDIKPRLSAQTGEFYIIDLVFVLIGMGCLFYKRTKEGAILLLWFFIAPLPSSLVAEAPHAGRASFMMGSWHLISAIGFYYLFSFFRGIRLKVMLSVIVVLLLSFSLFKFVIYYFGEYDSRYAIEWQYGMKQVVEYVKDNPQYGQVYMTDKRSQPYIFFLYYLKTPLPEYLSTVLYNNSENKSYNLVSGFDRYFFGGLDVVEIKPEQGVLYILTSSEYDGLRQRSSFDVKKVINYPNGTVAFYIVN